MQVVPGRLFATGLLALILVACTPTPQAAPSPAAASAPAASTAARRGCELGPSGPGTRALPDVLGKPVGIAGRGDTMEISTRLLLAKHGLDPDGVTFVALGFGNGRLAAVESAAVAAAILGI